MTFYEKYLSLCKQKGMSPSAAAVDAGLTRASVSRWKNGAIPTDASLLILCEYFGVKPVDLISDDREKFGELSRNLDSAPAILGIDQLKEDERLLLESYRTMGDAERFAMQTIAKRLKEGAKDDS